MKKLLASIVCVIMMVSMAFAAFADTTIPSSDIREEADSLEFEYSAEGEISNVIRLRNEGVRLFDTERLLTAEEADKIEEVLDMVSDETGFDVTIVTTKGYGEASDIEDFADLIYYEADFGYGSEKTGTMFAVNLDEGDIFIYTHGDAIRYITDSQQAYIFDELEGGMVTKLRSGEYGAAFAIYAAGVLDAFEGGIYDDQTNYNTQTGEYDPYIPEKKKSIGFFEVIISAIVSAGAAILPVNGVKRKYAMQTEKRMAEGFNHAYRANSKLALAAGASGVKLVSRNVTRAPIPKQNNSSRGGSGHGGGISSVSSGRGGSVHGGSGRKL